VAVETVVPSVTWVEGLVKPVHTKDTVLRGVRPPGRVILKMLLFKAAELSNPAEGLENVQTGDVLVNLCKVTLITPLAVTA